MPEWFIHSLNLESGKGRIPDFKTTGAVKIYKSDIDVFLQFLSMHKQ